MLFIAEQLGNTGPGKGSGSRSCAATSFYQECLCSRIKNAFCVFCLGRLAPVEAIPITSVLDVLLQQP